MNVHVFGYVAYTYLLLLMVPLFYWYKYNGESHRRLEMTGIFALLFFALLFFQAMVVDDIYRGSLVGSVVDFLSLYIGAFGLWIVWLMMVTVSIILVMEQSLSELAQPIKEYMDKPLTSAKPVQMPLNEDDIPKTKISQEHYSDHQKEEEKNLPVYASMKTQIFRSPMRSPLFLQL